MLNLPGRAARRLLNQSRSKAPNSKLQAPEKFQTPNTKGRANRIWSLVLLWSLDVGPWRFTLTAAIGGVGPGGNQERDVIFCGGIRDNEADRDAVEKAALTEVIADEKDQLVVAGFHFVAGEQRSVSAAVRIRLHAREHF